MGAILVRTKRSLTLVVAAIIAIAVSAPALAQENYYIINGVVKDATTKQELVFASVSVAGTNIGIVTNTDGEFTLKIPKSLGRTDFEISHLGYRNGKYKVEESAKPGQVFYISPSSVELDAVVVRPKNPRDIVAQAISNIYGNYSNEPVMLTGFYRETVKQGRTYLSVAEAVTSIYKAPYVGIESDRVKVLKARKGENLRKADTLMVKMQGGPKVALYVDAVKNTDIILSLSDMADYDYSIVDVVTIDNCTNYVVSFVPVVNREYPLYMGKIYITTDELAISMVQYSLDISDLSKATGVFVKKKPAGLRFEPQSTNYLTTYKKVGDRYYLNYVRSEVKFSADWRRRIFRTNYTIMSEMAITQRDTVAIEKIPGKESFRANAILADRVNEYFDENYWGGYNTIEPDESIQSAIKKFNRRYNKQ